MSLNTSIMQEEHESVSSQRDAERIFRLYTKESRKNCRKKSEDTERLRKEHYKLQKLEKCRPGHLKNGSLQSSKAPDTRLEDGCQLPLAVIGQFSSDFIGVPLEDIDRYYGNRSTFLIVNGRRNMYRFNSDNALGLFSPWNPLRQLAIAITTHYYFSIVLVVVILMHCREIIYPTYFQHTIQGVEDFSIIFIGFYTLELVLKVVAKGFVMGPCTYLRNVWNCVDFLVVLSFYLDKFKGTGTFPLRAIRIVYELKSVGEVAGVKILLRAVLLSLKNQVDVVVLTVCTMFVFALFGMDVYKGVLSHKCVIDSTTKNISLIKLMIHNESLELKEIAQTNLLYLIDQYEDAILCGNITGSISCPENFACLPGIGLNPDNGYTSFDTFWLSLLSIFRIITQESWDKLYRQILYATGPWSILFFVMVILPGSLVLMNLTVAVITMSYDLVTGSTEEMKTANFDETPVGRILEESGNAQEMTRSSYKSVSLHPSPVKKSLDSVVKHSSMFDLNINDSIQLAATITTTYVPLDLSEKTSTATNERTSEKLPSSAISKCINYCCLWNCASCSTVRNLLAKIAFHPFTEIVMGIIVLVNVLAISAGHHGMEHNVELTNYLININKAIILAFSIECVVKIVAMSPKMYFKTGWGKFEFVLVILSNTGDIMYLPVLYTAMSSLRLFKVARLWPALNVVIMTARKTFVQIANLVIVLNVIIFVFAVIGKQLYGKPYPEKDSDLLVGKYPRWNFSDFSHSYLLIFRVICGEWIESMWDCMKEGHLSSIAFFICVVIVGNLIFLNMFLTIIMSSFDSNQLKALRPEAEAEAKSVYEAIAIIRNATEHLSKMGGIKSMLKQGKRLRTTCSKVCTCKPGGILKEYIFRFQTWSVASSKLFNCIRLTIIFAAFVPLLFDDALVAKYMFCHHVMYATDLIVTIVFLVELFVHAVRKECSLFETGNLINAVVFLGHSMGVISKWNLLGDLNPHWDLLISLRAVRIMELLQYNNKFRTFLVAYRAAIPNFCSMSLSCAVFWLVFAIVGVYHFAGKFAKCITYQGIHITLIYYKDIPNKAECLANNQTWAESPMNFNHLGNAFLSLLQVSTFKGWTDIMNDAVDSREVGEQPYREASYEVYIYFIIFIFTGSFFTSNLLSGVLISHYLDFKQKDKEDSSARGSVTKIKIYDRVMSQVSNKKPLKTMQRSGTTLQKWIRCRLHDSRYHLLIFATLILNVAIKLTQSLDTNGVVAPVLYILRIFLASLLVGECIVSVFAKGFYYLMDIWSYIEATHVTILILDIIAQWKLPNLLQVPLAFVRILRLLLKLRRIDILKGLRTLIVALKASSLSLLSMSLVYFSFLLVFSAIGMSIFKRVDVNVGGLDEVFNFRTFGQSLALLFQLSTSAGWNNILRGILSDYKCTSVDEEDLCLYRPAALLFLLAYLVASFLLEIAINTLVVDILLSYREAIAGSKLLVSQEDMEVFYDVWSAFDCGGSGYIEVADVKDLMNILGEPFAIPKQQLQTINISEGNTVHYVDLMDAILRYHLEDQHTDEGIFLI